MRWDPDWVRVMCPNRIPLKGMVRFSEAVGGTPRQPDGRAGRLAGLVVRAVSRRGGSSRRIAALASPVSFEQSATSTVVNSLKIEARGIITVWD